MNLTNTMTYQSTGRQTLPPSTCIANAHFRISNLDKAVAFYRDLAGLTVLSADGKSATLSQSTDGRPVLHLTEDTGAESRKPRSPGLFHLALLYPRRKDLAFALKRLHEWRWPFQGFADHGVSEALYLADPDGNGIELYIDRPRETWPYRNGQLQMVTEPLDVENLLSEITSGNSAPGSGPSIGHVHLQVSDLHKAEEFYHGVLGFDITQRNFPGALFMSAGGYHHHIGINTWNSRGGSPASARAKGLVSFALQVNDAQFAQTLRDQTRQSEFWIGQSAHGFILRDKDNIQIEIIDP